MKERMSRQKLISVREILEVELVSREWVAWIPRSCLIDVYKLLTSMVTRMEPMGTCGIVLSTSRKCPVSRKYERVSLMSGVRIFSRCFASGEKQTGICRCHYGSTWWIVEILVDHWEKVEDRDSGVVYFQKVVCGFIDNVSTKGFV